MKPGGVLGKLFMGQYFFTIALRKKQPGGLAGGKPFRAETVIPATKNEWAADPMLVDNGDRTWLFYEAVRGDKGRIEAAEVLAGCRIGEPTVILEDDCHYSYPFVFSANGNWYMIPESSAAGEIRLYRAAEFPFKWELQTVLLKERAVDTTVFRLKDRFWMLTFVLDNATERVYPKAYTVTDWNAPEPKEVPWPEFDPLRVRGAGPVMFDGERPLRPAQISTERRYGDGLVFYSVEPSENYRERSSFEVLGKSVAAKGYFADGLHTYSSSRGYEAIDIRCREAEPFKLLKRILHK